MTAECKNCNQLLARSYLLINLPWPPVLNASAAIPSSSWLRAYWGKSICRIHNRLLVYNFFTLIHISCIGIFHIVIHEMFIFTLKIRFNSTFITYFLSSLESLHSRRVVKLLWMNLLMPWLSKLLPIVVVLFVLPDNSQTVRRS